MSLTLRIAIVSVPIAALASLAILMMVNSRVQWQEPVHAQSSPSITIHLSPGHGVPMDTEVTATVVLENLDVESYSSVVLRADLTRYAGFESRCNGEDTGKDIDIAVDKAREVVTLSVFKACPSRYSSYGSYKLDVSISVPDETDQDIQEELASATTRFLMTRYLTPGVPTATPPAPDAQAWVEPDPTSFDWHVGEWRLFRFRSNILLYSNDHFGAQAEGTTLGHFAAGGQQLGGLTAQKACEDPLYNEVQWRRAINQSLWIVPCKVGTGRIYLSHETIATDPLADYEVRILAKRPNAQPVFDEGNASARRVAEEMQVGTNVGSPVNATDSNNDPLIYSLAGSDAGSFTIDTSGQLKTAARLDHEDKSSYSVTVSVHDGKDADGEADSTVDDAITVSITVTNVDEAGAITLSQDPPQVSTNLEASLSDPDGGVSGVTWQWWLSTDQVSWTQVDGASSATFTPLDSHAGDYLRASASYGDGHGSGKSAQSNATSPVAAASSSQGDSSNIAATGAPTISGTARVGETLTASTSAIEDEDGLDDVSFSYQWIRGDADINDATSSTYELVDADQGNTIKVRVSFTDDEGNAESLTSAATSEVAARPNRPATGQPTISGTAQVGQTLTASTSGITDEDGLDDVSYSYQWVRNDANADTHIQGATTSTYELVDDDEGKTIKVKVSFEDDQGHQESLTSAATNAVAARPNRPATGTPTISGTATVGQTLTASTSGIADADGLDDVSYHYQWIRNDGSTDSDIGGATGSTYELADADRGKTIKVKVSFTDDRNNSESLTSAATATVAARPNNPASGAPTINGTPKEGQTLAASTGGIADADGLDDVSYSYQWIRNDGTTDTDIQDATASSYTLTWDDVGKTVKVKVSFTDDEGNQESLTSGATVAVAATPLTATVQNAPGPHNGSEAFTFELQFSENVRLSYKNLRDHGFQVTEGTVTRAKRLDKPSNVRWQIHVQPSGNANVTITLPPTTDCDEQGAVCTHGGKKLSGTVTLTVSGPS